LPERKKDFFAENLIVSVQYLSPNATREISPPKKHLQNLKYSNKLKKKKKLFFSNAAMSCTFYPLRVIRPLPIEFRRGFGSDICKSVTVGAIFFFLSLFFRVPASILVSRSQQLTNSAHSEFISEQRGQSNHTVEEQKTKMFRKKGKKQLKLCPLPFCPFISQYAAKIKPLFPFFLSGFSFCDFLSRFPSN
jgi:hypothetical protein